VCVGTETWDRRQLRARAPPGQPAAGRDGHHPVLLTVWQQHRRTDLVSEQPVA
jgi:hypothetical protein